KFTDLYWLLRRGAMLGQWTVRSDLERLKLHLQERANNEPDCLGLIEALLDLEERGFPGLAERLELARNRKKISEVDIESCFLLGSRGDTNDAELFLKLYRDVRGRDFWARGLQRCALVSFAYARILSEPV